MKEWISKINQHRRQSDIRLVLFNIIDIAGLVGGTVSMFISYFAGLPIPQIIAIFVAVIVLAASFYTANFKNNVNVAAFMIVFVISLFLFPIMFYTNGGLYSGMGFWFLLGIIFNFLLIEGALCYYLLILQIAVMLFCYIHTYFHPETVIPVGKTGVYIDVIQSLVVVSLIVGLIVRFQNMVYKEKLRELYEMNEEKERLAKIAADANRAKSSFLAQMSHEIRTPINAVLGMNEMILRQSEDAEILDYARNIDSAGNTLLTLINSILDFSKIEDGKMDIIPVEYDVASLINDLYHSIIQWADTKGLEMILDVDETLPCTLIGDNVRVSQVIMNLLTNAVKYTERGSVTLSIQARAKDGNNVKIFVSVKDTGIGIRKEDLGRLFESFERLDEVRNHNIEGTGPGISIVTSLLSMMGSRLMVESKYGEGSCFSFILDQKIADETPIGDYEKRVKDAGAHKDKEDVISAPSAKVLLVDDNEMNLKVARNLLMLCDICPDMALSGAETIERMRQMRYDIVFLDHMMPGMDGIETLNRLKSEGLVLAHTAMVVLTANAVVGARETYLAAGFHDYLSKPIELKFLVEKLEAYLPEEAYGKSKEDKAEGIVRDAPEEDSEIFEFIPQEEENGILEFVPEEEKDVLEFVSDGTAERSEENRKKKGYDLEELGQAGVDVRMGLNYCAGDEKLYFEMLDEFVLTVEKRLDALDGFLQDEKWHDYEIAVHALKSNAKTIGANEAYKLARQLEEAATQNDAAYIRENHGHLVESVRDTRDCIKGSAA